MAAITIIDFDTGLKARALWTLAAEHYRKGQELEYALNELLKLEDDGPYCGHFSDALFDGTFDMALKKSEMSIAPPKKQKRR
jgi:hypothetical protein